MLLVLLCAELCAANASTVNIKYSLNPARATLGEPIYIRVVITNDLPEVVIADFGLQGTRNFAIEVVRPGGQRVAVHPPQREGLALTWKVKIEPGQTYNRDILLSELLPLDVAGLYKINIRLMNLILAGAQVAALDHGATLNLTIEPRNEVSLQRRCSELAQRLSEAVTAQDAQSTAKALSTINDPVAVPYLKQAAISVWHVDAITIPALVRIGDATAADALIELLHSNVSDTERLARSALAQIENTTGDVQLRNHIQHELQRAVP